MVVIPKNRTNLEDRLDSAVQGELEKMSDEGMMEVLREEFRILRASKLDYTVLMDEIESYDVALPVSPDIVDLADINKRYALAQAGLTRVSNIERQSIMNYSLWERYSGRLEEYINCQKCKLLVEEDIMKLSNAAMQQAEVRNRLSKIYNLLSKIEQGLSEADAFRKVVESKKKDLASIITNLSRQVKVLSLESSMMR